MKSRGNNRLRTACVGRAGAGLWAALAVAGAGIPAWGQAMLVQSPHELKRMTVAELLQQEVMSVTRTPEPLGQAASSLFLLGDRAARGSGSTTLPEVLRLVPNLFVAQSNASNWAIGARGFVRANSRVNKMQVRIDGRTVYSPLFSGVFWDVQDVFVPDLERIEVISGPAGATWGSNAVNGVINILTKSAADTQGGVLYAGVGSELRHNVGGRYGGTWGDRGHYRVYGKHHRFDGTLSAAGVDDQTDAWEFTQAGFRLDWGDTADGAFTLQGYGYAGRYNFLPGTRARNDGANVLARWEKLDFAGTRTVARVYHDYTWRNLPGSIAEKLHTSEFDFQQTRALGTAHVLTWGGYYRHLRERVRNPPAGFAILPAALSLDLWSLYLEDTIVLQPDAWRLSAGARFEHNDYTGWEIQPSTRVAWQVQPHHTIWGAISRAARTPSRIDTDFFVPQVEPFLINGGPDFRSEILHAYELGWRGQLRTNLAATLTLYRHQYDHLRSVEPTTPVVVANGVVGRSYGAEFFLDWDVTPIWRLRLGGFRMVQRTRLAPGSADTEGGLGESSFPGYQWLLRSSVQLTRDLDGWFAWRHIAAVPGREGTSVGIVPAYTELDARLGWRLRPDLELSLLGRNLLHRSHPEIGLGPGRREIERSVHLMLRWEY